ncbi:MAG: fumarylacetoacetate hydrolase family protein [Bacteroidales bacterium]|nr:fumarylacetoacetate hydrolase family protein [Bacteroidales bacterium]MCL2738821.1 fumarylacetoacetate hydrolase family protein [Bacteroidales bacterium]
MKLICLPYQSPHFYLKPDTALLRNGRPFYVPDFCQSISGALALVVKINRLGRQIVPRFARRYYQETALGFCLYAADLLEQNRAAGVSCAPACALDYSAPLSDVFCPAGDSDIFAWEQWAGNLNRSIDQSIADVSRYMFLKMGDLIWIELHPPLPLSVPSQIHATRNGQTQLRFSLR